MNKLLSVDQVIAMWPEGSRPTAKALKSLAKAHGCCRKLGRAIGFTEADVERLMDACSPARDAPRYPSGRPLPSKKGADDEAYHRVRAMLQTAAAARKAAKA
jgi:hypothetical protein